MTQSICYNVILKPGDLVTMEKEVSRHSDLYVVLKEFFDESSMSLKLQVFGKDGKVLAYPILWFHPVLDV